MTSGRNATAAGNRKLFFDQYVTLLLMATFAVQPLRASALNRPPVGEKTRRELGIERTALELAFRSRARFRRRDASARCIQELAAQAVPLTASSRGRRGQGLMAVDGSIFSGVSRMAWAAFWQDAEHRGVRLHLPLRRAQGRSCRCSTLTPAACSLRQLHAGRGGAHSRAVSTSLIAATPTMNSSPRLSEQTRR